MTQVGSYWTSSYLTTRSKHHYMIISHLLYQPPKSEFYFRTSILDLDDPDTGYWNHFSYHNVSLIKKHVTALDLNFGSFGFESLHSDPSSLRTWTTTRDYAFDISWRATSPLIYNMGVGMFSFIGGATVEWGLPACATTGHINMNGTTHTIDPLRSFTWYDRQFGESGPENLSSFPVGNWTWFELHFTHSTRASIWAIDTGSEKLRFATIRKGNGSHTIIPFTLEVGEVGAWTSPLSNYTYPQNWKLFFSNGDRLEVTSVRSDQELYSPVIRGDSAFEGFVTVSGRLLGEESSFGLVEMAVVGA
ncbi:hypothetical protein AnigIFM62618_005300 [Aspergillus niger]|nr:hypothetical protein AnigIFM62618_005300 [Aspergillus niger]